MAKYCQSCSMPLDSPGARGPAKEYCKHCTDAKGNLKPRAEVQRGIAMWLSSWQGGLTEEQALKRAEHFMAAMPAWAED